MGREEQLCRQDQSKLSGPRGNKLCRCWYNLMTNGMSLLSEDMGSISYQLGNIEVQDLRSSQITSVVLW